VKVGGFKFPIIGTLPLAFGMGPCLRGSEEGAMFRAPTGVAEAAGKMQALREQAVEHVLASICAFAKIDLLLVGE
jgi:hypothetical protein